MSSEKVLIVSPLGIVFNPIKRAEMRDDTHLGRCRTRQFEEQPRVGRAAWTKRTAVGRHRGLFLIIWVGPQ
jgi:hypothetical protein